MPEYQNYIEYEKGTIPLVISVPHGGKLECSELPKRIKGIFGIDKGTIDLAKDFIKFFSTMKKNSNNSSIKPSYVISRVRRSKIDLNRPETEAFPPESIISKQIYRFYHDKIKFFIESNIKDFSSSLLVDIHGFESHKRPPGFRDVDLIIGTDNLKSLYARQISKKDWHKTLRGKLVKKFVDLKVPIAPGHPKRKEYVLTGGYITSCYGASQIPKSQALQIEFSDRIRIHNKQLKMRVLETLALFLIEEIQN